MWPDSNILVSSGVAALEAGAGQSRTVRVECIQGSESLAPRSCFMAACAESGDHRERLGNPEPELLGHLPVSTCS